jgi:hypothetical protein
MRSSLLSAAFVGAALVAGTAHAQDYTIKINEYGPVGKNVTVTFAGTTRSSFSIARGDMVLKEEKKVEVEDKQYTEKVLETGAGKPNKFQKTYTRAAKGKEGDLAPLSYAGKTIVFERKGDKYVVTAEEGGVLAKDLDDFARSANRPKMTDAIVPKNAVKVGDAWPIGKEAAEVFGAQADDGVDVANFKGQGKLVKAYPKGTQQWGTIEISLSVPVKKLGPLPLEMPIALQVTASLDTAIDGSTNAGVMNGKMTMKGRSEFTQNDMTFVIEIAVVSNMRQEQEPER